MKQTNNLKNRINLSRFAVLMIIIIIFIDYTGTMADCLQSISHTYYGSSFSDSTHREFKVLQSRIGRMLKWPQTFDNCESGMENVKTESQQHIIMVRNCSEFNIQLLHAHKFLLPSLIICR